MSEDRQIRERYDLTIERIRDIVGEETVAPRYRDYFQKTAEFILEIEDIAKRLGSKSIEDCTLEELKKENTNIYQDILEDNYAKSYANPTYAVSVLGEEIGRPLSFLYTEIRGAIAYVYEGRMDYLAICNELFVEIYNCFEGEEAPNYKEVKDIIYWYASDYSDVFLADRIEEQLNPECSFAANVIMNSDLTDLRYLYKFGEYISENEWKTAKYLNSLSQETIDEMANEYTSKYLEDAAEKSVINIQYPIGYERIVKKMIQIYMEKGLQVSIVRSAVSVLTKEKNLNGYYGGSANQQYRHDHCFDQGLILNKKLVERKLDVMRNTYEQFKELAKGYAGTVVLGLSDEPVPEYENITAISLTEKQESLVNLFENKANELISQYSKSNKYLL